MQTAATLNERLKSLRVQSRVTQRAIANGIGVSEGTVQKFEYGQAKPKLDTVVRLADFFNVSTDYLLGRADNTDSLERELVTIFRGLDTNERNALVKFAEYLRFSQAATPAALKKALMSPEKPQTEAGA